MTSIKFPAGTYYVGDIGYVSSRELWNQVCHKIISEKKRTFRIDGVPCAALSTQFGDGIFNDEDGEVYYVDSGTIGCLPIEAAVGDIDAGRVEKFSMPFTCAKHKDGTIRIGHIVIDTAVY